MNQLNKERVKFFKPKSIEGLELLTCMDVNYCFPPHFHEAYCIWLNNMSAEKYYHKGCTHLLTPGSFGIIEPGEVHSNSSFEADSRQLLTFYLDHDELVKVAEQIDEKCSDITFKTDNYIDKEALKKLMELNLSITSENSSLQSDCAFIEAISELLKKFASRKMQSFQFTGEQRRIKRVIDIFHSKFSEDISLDYLAIESKCTPYHLIRSFKKSVGMSPYAYLVELRLEMAKKLLSRDYSIIDTALEAGFSDQSHLTRKFKSKFGITPGVYKKQIA